MSRTIQPPAITVYSFSELSDKAKKKAICDYAKDTDYPHAQDAMKSIKALAAWFGATITNWSVDWTGGSHSYMDFGADSSEYTGHELHAMIEKLGSFHPVTKKGMGDCVLTGYCADEDAIDGLRARYAAGSCDIESLLQFAFKSWLKACQADYAHQFTEDAFADTAEVNEWEFLADGTLYSA